MAAVSRLSARFSAPLIERIYFMVAIIATIAVPMVVANLILSHMVAKAEETDKLTAFAVEARFIGLGFFVGCILLFWAPLASWKLLGYLRMRRMVKNWETMDVSRAGTGRFVPKWEVHTPGVFDARTLVVLTVPPNSQPSLFHPDAYLPPYINPPNYHPGGYTAPSVPLDEKKEFEEVKV